jgi:hypothetical protein
MVGGVLHSLHIPITGLLLGGLALAIVTIMAHNKNPTTEILKATASSYSPTLACMAMAFQG